VFTTCRHRTPTYVNPSRNDGWGNGVSLPISWSGHKWIGPPDSPRARQIAATFHLDIGAPDGVEISPNRYPGDH